MTDESMKPYVIVAIVNSVGDRQYVSEEEARIDAMERAEQTGHSYKVVKVCGTAVCHKKAHYHDEAELRALAKSPTWAVEPKGKK